jgi:alkylhydroperoxidase family enzyme
VVSEQAASGSKQPPADDTVNQAPHLAPLIDGRTERQARALEPWGSERAPNVFATLVRHIGLFEAWSPFAHKLLLDSALAPRHRELVILRVSWRIGSSYEWGHHVRIGLRAGLSYDEIESLATAEPGLGSALEAALVAATDELLDLDEMPRATWAVLERDLSSDQLVELLFLVGGYRMLAMALKTLGVAAERPLPPLGRSSVEGSSHAGGTK